MISNSNRVYIFIYMLVHMQKCFRDSQENLAARYFIFSSRRNPRDGRGGDWNCHLYNGYIGNPPILLPNLARRWYRANLPSLALLGVCDPPPWMEYVLPFFAWSMCSPSLHGACAHPPCMEHVLPLFAWSMCSPSLD